MPRLKNNISVFSFLMEAGGLSKSTSEITRNILGIAEGYNDLYCAVIEFKSENRQRGVMIVSSTNGGRRIIDDTVLAARSAEVKHQILVEVRRGGFMRVM